VIPAGDRDPDPLLPLLKGSGERGSPQKHLFGVLKCATMDVNVRVTTNRVINVHHRKLNKKEPRLHGGFSSASTDNVGAFDAIAAL